MNKRPALTNAQKLFCTLVAAGKTQKEAAAAAFPECIDSAPKGCREMQKPKILEHIEKLKEKYAPDIYEKVVKKGLEVLDKVKTAREFRDVSETLAKITPNMNEPERKDSRKLIAKLPDFIDKLPAVETPLLDGEMPAEVVKIEKSET